MALRSLIPGVYICRYCGLHHEKVEAGGVWHCPNPCCLGPGAAVHRRALASCTELPNGRHSVDMNEMFIVGAAKAVASGDPAIVTQSLLSMLMYEWRDTPIFPKR